MKLLEIRLPQSFPRASTIFSAVAAAPGLTMFTRLQHLPQSQPRHVIIIRTLQPYITLRYVRQGIHLF